MYNNGRALIQKFMVLTITMPYTLIRNELLLDDTWLYMPECLHVNEIPLLS